MTTSDIPGLPAKQLTQWIEQELPALDASAGWQAEIISGGLSNITYRLRLPNQTVILRRQPLGGIMASAHDMVREFTVLDALSSTEVPVPRVLALCTDRSVMGADFYVMSEVDGVVLRTAGDTAALSEPDRAELSGEMVSVLARVHSLDVEELGLGKFSRPTEYVKRQLKRWKVQAANTPLGRTAAMGDLVDRLSEVIPPQRSTSLLHGDFKIDNTLVSPGSSPRIVGVLDWELSSLGDPLADLGLALTYWHDPGDEERHLIPVSCGLTAHQGFWTSAQVADAYGTATDRDLSDLEYYLAFGSFKLAAILAGVAARHDAGHTAGDYPDLTDAVPTLVARGMRYIDGRSPSTITDPIG